MRLVCLLALLLMALPLPAADPAFPLKDGDVWLMAGDSITAQHLHSNYFEAFCYARYPKMTFAFRNSGVGGHTIPSTLGRFEYDIAAWKPTVVSVELGMNDSGSTPTDKFIANMGTMVERIRKTGARPVILSPSPVNDGTIMAKVQPGNRNVRLSDYSKELAKFCEKEKVPYADQFHALVDVWGKNKPRERLQIALAEMRQVAADDTLAGVEQLRAFLTAQEKNPVKGISLLGDPVHPGSPGQLMMAAALLKGLGADGFVSSVTIEGGKATAKGCTVTGLAESNGGYTFERLDETLPFPISDFARPALELTPDILSLSQYTLTIKGLKSGTWGVKIGGTLVGKFTAMQLAEGINLTALPPTGRVKDANPITVQMRAILKAVDDKEGIVGQWRGLSRQAHAKKADPKLMTDLAALTEKVKAADVKIRAAAKPKALKFEVVPVEVK